MYPKGILYYEKPESSDASRREPARLSHPSSWLVCLHERCGVHFWNCVSIAFFTIGGVFGPLNDIAVIVQYTLMLPIAIKVYRLVRPYGPLLSQVATVIGIVGMLAVIILQTLLVAGVLPFNQQIGKVSAAFLVVLVWFVLTGHLGRHTIQLPKGIILYILAGLYFCYPVWAFSLGRRLMKPAPAQMNGETR
jgi:hypothetical protein